MKYQDLEEEEEKTPYFKRYREIIGILVKYGFEDIVAHTRFKALNWQRFMPDRDGTPAMQFSRYERIRLACEELGATFIKFGQILSNRADLFPQDLLIQLERLQDKVPSVPFNELKPKLEREFGKPLEDVFGSIVEIPLASASIAQVHKVKLKTGEEAVLKIQKPSIRKNVTADIEIMRDLAKIIENNFPESAVFQPVELVTTFEKAIKREMNFVTEATSMKRFTKNFAADARVYVPKVYDELTTQKVICQEFVDGKKLSDVAAIKAAGLMPEDAAKMGLDLYFIQVFEHGFFHADPHPGNIFVMPDGRLSFIDFGMMGTLAPEDQFILGDLMYYIYVQDTKKLADTIEAMSKGATTIHKRQEFEQEIRDFLEQAHTTSISEVEMSDIIEGLRKVMYDYKISISSNFHLLMRALIIIEGVGLTLYPEYNLMEEVQPYAKRIMAKRYSPKELFKRIYASVQEVGELALDLPNDIREILFKLKEGKLRVEFEHKGLEPMTHKLDVVSNRIAFAIIVAAMILGSAIVIHAKIPPMYHNVPILGIITFVLAGFFAFRLLYSISKHGKM
jgi:ubiquinone biosynthesis protein